MNNKKKIAFLTLAMTMGMVLGACNPGTTPSSSNNPSSGSADTSSTVEPSTSSSSSSESKPSSSADTSKPTSSSTQPSSSSTQPSSSSSSSTSSPASSSSSSSSSVAPTAVSLSVNLDNVKTAYTRGEALNLTGIVVTATFSDGTSRAVHSYTTNPANGTVLDQVGEKEVVVTYKEATTSFKVTVANKKFTVKFVVDGVEVQTYEVEEGQAASYTGETPTKAPDANAVKYRFKGWDKDLTQPITADTTFTAVFAEYAAEQVIDNFEDYESNSDMADAWTVEAYTTAWGETAASVSIGSKAAQGNKALRFDGWENGTGFRFLKHNEVGAFAKSANAIKFNLQIPTLNTVKVILKGKATIMGQVQEPSFTYEFKPTSNEYVEYTIPLAANEWQLWQQAGQTIKTAADMIGAHVDDIVNYITDVGFFVQGKNDGNLPYFAFADNIRFVTIDEPAAKSEVETMGQYTKYTGLLNNGNTVKVELGANGAATATVIDMETPQQIPGNVVIDANKNMTFTSADAGATLVYKAQLKNGGQSMKFVEAGGAFAEAVTGVDLNAVQVVDNYEQYTSDGQAYCQKYPDINARSGCRGAYYSEYYAGEGNSSPWGGSGWSLMGSSGEQLKLKQDQAGAHSGNNYLCLKHSKSVAMRYMQWGLFDGTAEQNNFRGSKFSFWAKTNGLVKQFKVSMYSQSKPTNQTKDSYVKTQTFEQTEAIGQWKHFEIDLNPELTYYGFMINIEKNYSLSTNEAFLYIDDVEVYTANPYATYVPPVPPVENKALVPGNAYLGKIGGLINATLRIKSDTEVTLAAPGMAMELNGTYTIAEDELTMVVGGATYKATISEDLDKLTFVSVEGEGQVAGALNNLSFDIIRGENVESYTETGRSIKKGDEDETKNSGSSGAFYIDMYKGGSSTSSPVGGSGWDLTGSGAGAALNKEDAAEGSQSLKLLNSQWGNMRYIQWDLYKGTAKPMTGMTSFSLYLKNYSADVTQKVKIMAYKVQKVDNAHQGATHRTELEVTLEAGQDWTKYTVALDATKTYYGFAILNTSKGSSSGKDYYVGADAMCFSNVDNDPSLNYYAKNGLALNGTITAGAATMTFGQNGTVTLHNDMLGGDLAGTYKMAMSGSDQLMTIETAMGNITGTYAVNPAGKVTFTVTAVEGDLAAGVNVGAVLSNQ